MRNSIAGAWLYSMIMIFMVFMIGYVAVSINYNKTYQVKELVLSAVEEYQGVNEYSINGIRQILKSHSSLAAPCSKVYQEKSNSHTVDTAVRKSKNMIGITQKNGSVTLVPTAGGKTLAADSPQQVCIKKEAYNSEREGKLYTDYYYTVYMFFNFDLPLFGNIINFTVSGQTNSIYYPYDTVVWD